MYDILFNLSANYPAWLIAFMVVISAIVGGFIAYSVGSFRWWYVKRTRLPFVMREARTAYEAEIASLKAKNKDLWERLQKAQTAAYGEVVMTFRSAIKG